MKRNFIPFAVAAVMSIVIGLTAIGCKTLTPTQQLLSTIVIQQGTSRFIEYKDNDAERSARAVEVIRVVGLIKFATASQGSTIADLQAQALALVAHAGLQLSDQALANALISTVGQALQDKISAGVLSPAEVVQVNSVLDQITATAQVYVQNAAAS